MDITTLFLDHLRERLTYVEKALAATGFETLVISSGAPLNYFADDQAIPFRAVPHFRHYCPIAGPHHVLKLKPGHKPLLIRFAPEDYWYEQSPLDTPFWVKGFEIVESHTLDHLWETLGKPKRGAYIGNETDRAEAAELNLNPENLTTYLDWGRGNKTPYEIRSLEEATELGAKGHIAGRLAFLAGASERDIHYAFTQAVGCLDHELAFPSIVALEPKGATLHYENKRSVGNGKTLLLDCGARVRDYNSDITRTVTSPACDSRFVALVAGLEKLQQDICAALRPALPFGELHHLAHLKLGKLLLEAGLLKTEAEESVQLGLTRPFLPHGLGHHLGVVVHDVGGRLSGPDGTLQPPPAEYPTLRTTRTTEAGQVLTIEPGLYFIPMLLRPFREGEHAAHFNWKLIDELMPLGGMRIEDNILVTPTGSRNITREYLPD